MSIFPASKQPKKTNMVSLETIREIPRSPEPNSSPRISFSADFLDEKNFISISPNSPAKTEHESERGKSRMGDFEFLSNNSNTETMIAADELFFEGKILPFWQIQHIEKLSKVSLKDKETEQVKEEVVSKEENRVNWFIDDDPSPRPPKCTVLFKELLRLKKQRASSLSPSSSSSSSSSSTGSFGDLPRIEEEKEGSGKREKHVKRVKKGLDRTRSASIRIRPMVNVPICTQGKNNGLPPLFSLKKGKLER